MNKLMIGLTSLLCAVAVILLAAPQTYSDDRIAAEGQLLAVLRGDLAKKYPKAKVDVGTSIQWLRGGLPQEIADVRILNETGRGDVQFSVGTSLGSVSYSAWAPVHVAVRRILPGEKLAADQFVSQEINLVSGQAFQYRGVILPEGAAIEGLEARQTILEGQNLLTTAVQRTPDIRRGDVVRIELQSGDLRLTTQGIAQEPSYLSQPVHVISAKTKRELIGTLSSAGVVEVKL